MRVPRRAAALACCALGVAVQHGSAAANARVSAVADLTPALRGAIDADALPGAAAVVVSSDGLIASGYAGIRSSADPDTPIAAGDLWHLGSNTKVLTALVAARLVDRGLISWESTIGDVLRDEPLAAGGPYARVTLRQLLDHTSGVPTVTGLGEGVWAGMYGLDAEDQADRAQATRWILETSPMDEPGAAFVYSNLGYMLAGAMLEAASGSRWASLMRSELAEPLGLESLGFGPPGRTSSDQEEADGPTQPLGHAAGRLGPTPVPPQAQWADNPAVLGPAGTAHLSMADYAVVARVMLSGAQSVLDADAGLPLTTKDEPWVSRAGWRAVLAPLAHDPPQDGYGLGVIVQTGGEHGPLLSHSGSNTMWFTTLTVYPGLDRAAAVAMNVGGAAAESRCLALAYGLPKRFTNGAGESNQNGDAAPR